MRSRNGGNNSLKKIMAEVMALRDNDSNSSSFFARGNLWYLAQW